MKKNKLFYILGNILAVVMMLSTFLPFAVAGSDSGLRYVNMDIMSLSDFSRGYIHLANIGELDELTCVLYVTIIGIFLLVNIILLITSLTGWNKTAIVFNVLSIIIFSLLKWDFSVRGVVPSSHYHHGVVHYLFYIVAMFQLGCLIMQIIIKKQNNDAA